MSDISEQLLASVGNLAGSFAVLEFEIVDCLSLIVNDADLEIGMIVCDRLSFSQTLTLIGDFTRRKLGDSCCSDFRTLSRDLQAAARLRNDILHSSWAFPLDGEQREVFQERARRRNSGPDVHDAEELLARLAEGRKQMWELYDRVITFKKNYLC